MILKVRHDDCLSKAEKNVVDVIPAMESLITTGWIREVAN